MRLHRDIRRWRVARTTTLVAAIALTSLSHKVVGAGSGHDVVVSSSFEGSPSLILSNGELELTVLQRGASLASIVLQSDSDKMNPLWNPVRMNREQGREADPSATTGHFICVDGFGPMSKEEKQAGMPFCGEAHAQRFEVHSSRNGFTKEVTLTAKLPIVQEELTRVIRMVDGESVVYVESQLENLMGFDRPINWGEHGTVGSPFLEPGVTVFDLSGDRSHTTPYTEITSPMDPKVLRRLSSDKDFSWPMAPGLDGNSVDLRQTPKDPHFIDNVGMLMDPSRELEWATALNPKRKLILGYVFRRDDFPWMHIWGNFPPSVKLAHAFEFATQPFPAPRRETITTGSVYGSATYRWLPADSKITTRFLMFYARVPEGFTRVDDVRMENGQIIIEDHSAHKQFRLAATLTL